MKRLGWGILAFMVLMGQSVSAGAIETSPTTPNKVSGPLLITGYSFSGSSVRYVQLFNASSALATLDGWQIISTTKAVPQATTTYLTLNGFIEPGKHAIASVPGLVSGAQFTLPASVPAPVPLMGSVSLVPPLGSGFADETVSVPTITTSTLKETEGVNSNHYLKRDVSTSTGNYVSGFTFTLPIDKLKNDSLYVPPSDAQMQISEIYPDAVSCSPFDTSATCNDYVKVYNPASVPLDLSRYRIRTGAQGSSATGNTTRVMSGVLQPGHYTVVPMTLSSSGSWVWIEDAYGIVKFDRTLVAYPSSTGHDNQAWAYDPAFGSWGWALEPRPSDQPSVFPEPQFIQQCTDIRISEIAANVAYEDQFIELYNPSDRPVDVGGCRLQTNRSVSASFGLPELQILPSEHVAVYIKDTGLTLTKTTSGRVYLLSSDQSSEVDSVDYADLDESSSWSLIEGDWRQTFAVTPNEVNAWQEFARCADGYIRNVETGNCNKVATASATLEDCGQGKYRSPETNRCRSLESLPTALTPCEAGQYRNTVTNRCRSLATAASLLVPCASNQERNPDTNRCRSITSSTNDLKPCTANQERNPETNRCRNKSGSIVSDFPVEAVTQGGQATLGWWAFGGVGVLATGYAGWEWRREVSSAIAKVGRFLIGRG